MTNATSLAFIAAGAILAFAVNFEIAGVSIKTIGAILIVVGSIGLTFALVTLIGYAPWGNTRVAAPQNVAAGASTGVAEPATPQAPVRPPTDA